MLSKRLILWIAAICLSISVLMLYSEYRTKNLLQDFLLNKDLLEIVNKITIWKLTMVPIKALPFSIVKIHD